MTAEAPHLSRLTLRRFRSHEVFDRRIDARPVVLVGPNGAGKTNILEAVSLLAPGRGMRGASAADIAQKPDPIGWSVSAEMTLGDETRKATVTVDLSDGARKVVRLDDAPVASTALGALARAVWLTPAMDRLWTEGASERRKFIDRTTLAFDPAHAERSTQYERAMRERNRLLKEGGGSPAWFDALERRMAEAGAAIRSARRETVDRLVAAQRADGPFPVASISLVESDAAESADALADALTESRPRDVVAGRTLVGPHRSDLDAMYVSKGIEAKLCSTGEQKALLLSLIIATARSLSVEGGVLILLLDEVAAHLDPDRRVALFDEVLSIGAQAWMTGADIHLFESLGDRAQHILLP